MSSPFGQVTQSSSSSPAFNPFASNSQTQVPNPFGSANAGDSASNAPGFGAFGIPQQQNGGTAKQTTFNPFGAKDGGASSDSEGKRKNNPFGPSDGNVSDSARSKKGGRNNQGAGPDFKQNTFGARNDNKSSSKGSQQSNGRNGFGGGFGQASQGSNFSQTAAKTSYFPTNSNDPHARRVYSQLHKDGISPPQWPSKPGDPGSKTEMAKFRERYDAYRDKVRASLTKAGLIDDPDKRKTLRDAIEFKGICEDMCPEYEKITRITENDVPHSERDVDTTYPSPTKMIKKLARSAAGQEAPLPMDVRSVPTLRKTLDYLIDDLLRTDGNLPVLHGYLWDRTRAIRRDFTFFSSLTTEELKTQVYVLENIARFHVTALHLLSEEGKAPEEFVEQQELEQLGKCLLSLRDLYDDCGVQGIQCENEAEFRAYYLIFHANDPNIIEILQRQWKSKFWKDSDLIRTAVSLVEALHNTQDFHGPLKAAPSLAASGAYQSYFRIVEDESVSYTMACFAECHFPQLRRSILRAVKIALARPKEGARDVTAADLNKFLRFDTVEEAVQFAELHDLEFAADNANPSDSSRQHVILNNRGPLPHPRLQHQFSRNFVESKRASRPFPDVIHTTVFGSASFGGSQTAPGEESLFVADSDHQLSLKPSPNTSQTFTSGFGPAFPQSTGTLGGEKADPSKSQGFASPFGASSKDTSSSNPPANPFASALSNETPNPSISSTPFGSPAGSFSNLPPEKPPQSAKPAQPFGSTSPFNNATTTSAPTSTSFGGVQPSSSPAPPASFPKTQSPSLPTGDTLPSSTSIPPAATKDRPPSQPSAPMSGTGPSVSQLKFSSPSSGTFTPKLSDSSSKPAAPAAPATGTTQFAPKLDAGSKPTSISPPLSTLPSSSNAGIGLSASPIEKVALSTSKQASLQPAAPVVSKSLSKAELLDNFARWYVRGDDGLLQDFQVYFLEDLLKPCFDKFVADREARLQREEEERNNKLADQFRVYNISLRYFYRWKNNARQKRLRALRRAGREQVRVYHETQRTAQQEAQKEAARKAAKERGRSSDTDRHEELKRIIKQRKVTHDQAEDALVASGVLSGVESEREAAASIVRKEFGATHRPLTHRAVQSMAPPTEKYRMRTRSPSVSSVRAGSKSQSLRDEFLGNDTAGFRRSMPPVASSEIHGGAPSSKVSERWRLKAMGIVQMPDGTAMPESLARDIRYGTKSYAGLGSSSYGTQSRRSSITRRSISGSRPQSRARTYADVTELELATNKRKRSSGDDGAGLIQNGESHKRVMSDSERLVEELRSMREEMQQGTSWFKSQNERLQSELESRGSTPWEGDIS